MNDEKLAYLKIKRGSPMYDVRDEEGYYWLDFPDFVLQIPKDELHVAPILFRIPTVEVGDKR